MCGDDVTPNGLRTVGGDFETTRQEPYEEMGIWKIEAAEKNVPGE